MRTLSSIVVAVTLGLSLTLAAVLVAPTGAEAQHPGRYPTRYVLRPLTLREGMLRIDGDMIYQHHRRRADGTFLLDARFGLGLTRDFEVGADFLPLELTPDVRYLQPSLYLMGRFVRGTAEVGVRGSITLPIRDGDHALIEGGLPILIHFGQVVRLDLGAFVQVATTDPPAWWARFPVALTFNPIRRLMLGPYAGFRVRLDAPGTEIPVGFVAAGTLGGAAMNPIGDIGGQFEFTNVNGSLANWSMALVTRWFLYF